MGIIRTIQDEKSADISEIKKREYLEDKINELGTNSMYKNRYLYRGINELKRTTYREIT
jgi:hypothetical protein